MLPSDNAGTLAPWFKGAVVMGRNVLPSCTKTILRGLFLVLCVLQIHHTWKEEITRRNKDISPRYASLW
mgnify:CR=1 FL=1